MKALKLSLLMVLSLIFMCAFIPSLSAKHRTRSSFGFNFNFDARPRMRTYVAPAPVYVAPAPAPVVIGAPVPVFRTMAAVEPAPFAEPVSYNTVNPYPYYSQTPCVQPAYTTYPSRAYIQPQYSYWTY
ncbi:MAG: hypothetical protein H0V82_00365 [Candidatus Protochlamydia sp.]|nr:hypothetical protein [Candidatus Protochlamydia sp.]